VIVDWRKGKKTQVGENGAQAARRRQSKLRGVEINIRDILSSYLKNTNGVKGIEIRGIEGENFLESGPALGQVPCQLRISSKTGWSFSSRELRRFHPAGENFLYGNRQNKGRNGVV